MIKKMMQVQRTVALLSMVALASANTAITSAAMAETKVKLTGAVSARGNVTINGIAATSGSTVFSGNNIRTAEKSSATVTLGKSGEIQLSPTSDLVVKMDGAMVGGQLRSGHMTVIAPAGVAINVATPKGVTVTDGKKPAILSINVSGNNTKVVAVKGEAKITEDGKTETVNDQGQAGGAAGGAVPVVGGTYMGLLVLSVVAVAVGTIAITVKNANGTTSVINATLSQFRP